MSAVATASLQGTSKVTRFYMAPTWNPHSESIPELEKFLHGASVPASLFAVQGCLGQTVAYFELAPSHRRDPTKGSLDGESQGQAEVQWLVT